MRRFCCLLAFFLFIGIPATGRSECVAWDGLAAPVLYQSSADAALLVRDLDGDSAPEIIASGNQVDERSSFSLFTNRGGGTFDAERLIPSRFGDRVEDVGDLDGDGIPDLLASNYWANGITVYRGKGALQFDEGTPHDTATHGGPSLIADYDRDGAPDIVSLSFGSGNPVRIHLFRGDGHGAISPKVTFTTQLANGSGPSTRIVDGVLEILVNERSGHLAILRFAGAEPSISKIDAGPGIDLASAFGDLNGDGIADIIDTDDSPPSEGQSRESIYVTLAGGSGTFLDRRQLSTPRRVVFPVGVRVADIDGDGKGDLVVSDFQMPALLYFRGHGDGAFDEAIPIDAGGPVNAFEIGDVNGDGALDLVTANDDHTISVILNRAPCHGPRRRAARH